MDFASQVLPVLDRWAQVKVCCVLQCLSYDNPQEAYRGVVSIPRVEYCQVSQCFLGIRAVRYVFGEVSSNQSKVVVSASVGFFRGLDMLVPS
jgi:hypothetical protein